MASSWPSVFVPLLLAFCRPSTAGSGRPDLLKFDLCLVKKCECDPVSQTASCRDVFFEYMPTLPVWLKVLIIEQSRLTALGNHAFQGAHHLRSLVVTHSSLEYVSPETFAGLDALEKLDLSHNALTHVPHSTLAHLPSLVNVDLSYNRIGDLDQFDGVLPAGRVLDVLNLAGNPIKLASKGSRLPLARAFVLADNHWLVKANASGLLFRPSAGCEHDESCRFLTLTERSWTVLSELNLGDCDAEIDQSLIMRASNLTSLNIASCYLESANLLNLFSGFKELLYLNMSKIHIHRLNKWDLFPPKVQTLDISGVGLSEINFQFLKEHHQLKLLDISHNKIKSFVLTGDLNGLETFVLAHNQLDAFPVMPPDERLATLKILDASYNNIEVLGPFAISSYPKIESLNLCHNRISTISDTAFPTVGQAMYELDLSYNLLTDMPALVLPTLVMLRLNSNRLRTIDPMLFQGLPFLGSFDVSRNPHLFASADARRGNELMCDTPLDPRVLEPPLPPLFTARGSAWGASDDSSAAANDYRCYPDWLQGVTLLRRLNALRMGVTGLTRLPYGFLASMDSLKTLDLSGNALTADALDAWAHHRALPPCLVTLDLSFNRLVSLGNASRYFSRMSCLRRLDLSHNPFICDCRMAEIRRLSAAIPDGAGDDGDGRRLVEGIQNESLYYCFAPKNHWQYPLSSFLAAVQPCASEYDFGLSFLKTLATLLFCVFALILCYMCCSKLMPVLCNKSWQRQIQYLYKPLRNEATAELNSPCSL